MVKYKGMLKVSQIVQGISFDVQSFCSMSSKSHCFVYIRERMIVLLQAAVTRRALNMGWGVAWVKLNKQKT